jgi:AcrR family transcriptional regulator/DNA-binding MarR family transcriptional regulator
MASATKPRRREAGGPAREVAGVSAREAAGGLAREVSGGPLREVAGATREHVAEIQRGRILAAMAEVASERGAGAASVAHVVACAGVSRRTFYDFFEDREECFLAAFELALAQAAKRVLPAWQESGVWRERVRAALTALLVFLDEEPALARLCVVQALAAGPRALGRRGEVLRALTVAVDGGREEVRRGIEPPPLAADGVIGGVLSVIHTRLLEDHEKPLVGLLGELMSMIVLPYQGPATARRELHKSGPTPSVRPRERRADPLEGLAMRITYRTVRVLMAIASHPAASNRQVAGDAGIADQGQISKLLTRLQHLGLIENHGEGSSKGAPNAWQLTAKGRQVEQAISTHNTT